MATRSGYRWDKGTEPRQFSTMKRPSKAVIGEIKPHNTAGITAGITQLRGRPGIEKSTPQLLTYRQISGQPTKYEVLAADSTQLNAAIKNRETKIDKWYTLGIVESSKAAEMIPRWECPTSLGNLLEPWIRRRYASRLGVTLAAKNSPSQSGADFVHSKQEIANFLRELAAELEAEARFDEF